MVCQRQERVVVEVLMVNHVVLQSIDYLAKIMYFKNKYSIVIENILYRTRNALYVRDVGVNVVRNNHVGPAVVCDDFFTDVLVEKLVDNNYPRIVNHPYDIGSRINANHRPNLFIGKWPQQNSVVATKLDNG